MKILTIVGARPQFIKAAVISRAIATHNRCNRSQLITEILVHTGQHYDADMSDIFFREMGIPKPAINLKINGGAHGEMTGKMLAAIEAEILSRKPDWVLVYGDTNSTLAGALAAAKLHVPVAHIEAGLRSFNRRMPEEINRVLTDHLSAILFCPTRSAMANLAAEGITREVHRVGDVMYDAALIFGELADRQSTILRDLTLSSGEYLLTTVHRAENTDDPARLGAILKALQALSEEWPVVFPVHPRTRMKLAEASFQISNLENLYLVDPVSFLDMVQLEKNARCILTDSGGIQKEAYFQGVPCITLRDETEWVETVDAGWNQIVGADIEKIIAGVNNIASGQAITEYGNGHASERIISLMVAGTNCQKGPLKSP